MKSKGLVHVYTGEGKGKTTAALGLALRAYGCGKKIAVYQFLKNPDIPCGELKLSDKLSKKFKIMMFKQVHPGFKDNLKDKELREYIKELKECIKEDFEFVKLEIDKGIFDLVVLDEIINVISEGYLKEDIVIDLMKSKPNITELVLTGRNASERLKESADYVTEMREVKHPYQRGLKARKGIEY